MRVIAGRYKRRQLKTISSNSTRPTTDKNKENLFNIIGPYFDGGICLDLFSGSGALGIEAISRGIEEGYFVDKNYKCIQVIKDNIQQLKIENTHVYKMDYKKALHLFDTKFDLVFLDPPYALNDFDTIMSLLDENHLLNEDAIIVIEDEKEDKIPEFPHYTLYKHIQYGITQFKIYQYRSTL